MLHVPFAHSIDAALYSLGTTFRTITANLTVRRKSSRMIETAEEVPMNTADQIAISGTLDSGAFIATHFRGGLSKGTNFHWEINGTKGDLIVTSPVGYIGVGGFRIQGASDSVLQDLVIPEKYGAGLTESGLAQNVALNYARFARDLKTGSHVSPTFDDAVELHRLIHRIEMSAEQKHDE
ncbi:MAG: Gfo/Idh/MocA family oxidoreductase [Verrucomicrobiota bacterium]